jgi:hypothetical protein
MTGAPKDFEPMFGHFLHPVTREPTHVSSSGTKSIPPKSLSVSLLRNLAGCFWISHPLLPPSRVLTQILPSNPLREGAR